MFFIPQINFSRLALLACSLVVVALGVSGPWIDFPLSDPVRSFRLSLELFDMGVSIFGLFIALLALAAIAVLYDLPKISLWLVSLSLLALLYIPVYIALKDATWIPAYIEDSVIRRDMQRFLAASFVPNKSSEPTLVLISEFEWLSERIKIAWLLMGWGWLVTTIGVISLVPQLAVDAQKRIGPKQWLMAFTGLPVLFVILLGSNAAYGEYLYIKAINVLKKGDYEEANKLLLEAVKADPVRAYSSALIDRVIESHFWTYGENNPISRLYLARQKEASQLQQTSDEARSMMADVLKMNFGDYLLADEIKQMAKKRYAQLCINDGLLKYGQNDIESARLLWHKAATTYSESWQAVLMGAKAAADVHDYQACINSVNALLDRSSKAGITADLYSTMGDCYLGMGMRVEARNAYEKSNVIDPSSNYRALKGLGGT